MSADIREYTELEIIEECFKAPHCESRHLEGGPCSHSPVALGRYEYHPEAGERLVCQNTVDYVGLQASRGCICEDCDHPVEECWIILPLT